MRIIAGKLRRRTLLTNPGLTTRPIIDRAKVKLFDLIRSRLPNAKVADLFCGTGTLGFESLSRGAASCVFAEADHRAHELLVQNAERLGVNEQSLCWRVDVIRSSFRPKGATPWSPYDVVYFDPPYRMVTDQRDWIPLCKALQRLARPDVTTDAVLLVVRIPKEVTVELPPPWRIDQTLEVASMQILLASKQSGPFESDPLATDEVTADGDTAEDVAADDTADDTAEDNTADDVAAGNSTV
jgi:16S rRNA (guanine966-N2)-methyltransferase